MPFVSENSLAVRPRFTCHQVGDRIYLLLVFFAALTIFMIIGGIAFELYSYSRLSIHTFGWHFIGSKQWNPVSEKFGAWGFILGTLYTSFWGLLIAVPISIGAAIFLAEIAPFFLRNTLSFLIELLAAVPSVVYGLWGIFVLAPWLVKHVETPISNNPHLSNFILFSAAPNGNDFLTASVILAIMVIPFITSVSYAIMRSISRSAKDGSYALGATRWESIAHVVLPFARSGIVGGVILGLGRALGETMAVTMVIGNNPNFQWPLFSPGYTMASVIANEFSEASIDLYRSSLIEIGLLLFLMTMIVNGIARILVYYTARSLQGGGR